MIPKKTTKILFALIILLLPVATKSSHIDLALDEDGWTVFNPSEDTDVVYISQNGDDSTCRSYRTSDIEMGESPFEPSGEVQSCATYSKAYSLTSENSPDWILFKRGEVFVDDFGRSIHSGKDADEPFLISSYGSSGAVPQIKTGISNALFLSDGVEWLAVVGLDFYAHTRDPENSGYVDSGGSYGISCVLNEDEVLQGVLIEGCKLRYYRSNVIQNDGAQIARDIKLRRNLISHTYSETAHSQGLYTSKLDNMIFEENIFYHNGWLVQNQSGNQNDKSGGQATWFNHHIYFTKASNMLFDENIFIEPAGSSIKMTSTDTAETRNITISNNLLLGGQIGMNIGNNTSVPNRFKNITIENNVLAKINYSRPTLQDYAWHLWLAGWDEGEVSGNLLIDQNNSVNNLSRAIYVEADFNDVEVSGNIIDDLDDLIAIEMREGNESGEISSVQFLQNIVSPGQDPIYVINASYDSNGYSFAENIYNFGESAEFKFRGENMDFSEFSSASGDTSSLKSHTFPDSRRSIETFQQDMGGLGSVEDFIVSVINQDRYNWNETYQANNINTWLREGYFLPAESGLRADVDLDLSIDSNDALLILRKALNRSMSGTTWQDSATTGDVNCDGSVTTMDALLTLREHLGLDNSSSGWCGG